LAKFMRCRQSGPWILDGPKVHKGRVVSSEQRAVTRRQRHHQLPPAAAIANNCVHRHAAGNHHRLGPYARLAPQPFGIPQTTLTRRPPPPLAWA
jgi:hypothetical protein